MPPGRMRSPTSRQGDLALRAPAEMVQKHLILGDRYYARSGTMARGNDAARWLAVILAVALLTACEHGSMSYNRSTGTFNMPFGQDSNR